MSIAPTVIADTDPAMSRRANGFRRVGTIAGALGSTVPFAIGIGALLALSAFLQGVPGVFTPPKLPGTLGSACLGASLVLHHVRPSRSRLIRLLTLVSVAIAGITLLEYLFDADLLIDHLTFRGQVLPHNRAPGRMAPNSAISMFLLASASLAMLAPSAKRIISAQFLALGAFLIASLALIGYAYSVEALYEITDFTAMSLIGAFSYFLLSTSVLFLRTEEGPMRLIINSSAGGEMARRLFVAVLVIPPILGSFSLLGLRLNMYDSSFSIALVVVMCMLTFVLIVGVVSYSLDRADMRRSKAEHDLARSRESLRELSSHVQTMQEEERRKIAREIHDELGQSLTALKMDVAMIKSKLPDDSALEERASSMLQLVDSTIKSVQRISSELRPGMLDDLGLPAALEWQAAKFRERSNIRCTLSMPEGELRIGQAQSTALFRIFQEALTNVARHAGALSVEIDLRQVDNVLQLTIKDDGTGIDPTALAGGRSLGLIGMRERAILLGGNVDIRRDPNGGTVVCARVPIPIDEDASHAIGSETLASDSVISQKIAFA